MCLSWEQTIKFPHSPMLWLNGASTPLPSPLGIAQYRYMLQKRFLLYTVEAKSPFGKWLLEVECCVAATTPQNPLSFPSILALEFSPRWSLWLLLLPQWFQLVDGSSHPEHCPEVEFLINFPKAAMTLRQDFLEPRGSPRRCKMICISMTCIAWHPVFKSGPIWLLAL